MSGSVVFIPNLPETYTSFPNVEAPEILEIPFISKLAASSSPLTVVCPVSETVNSNELLCFNTLKASLSPPLELLSIRTSIPPAAFKIRSSPPFELGASIVPPPVKDMLPAKVASPSPSTANTSVPPKPVLLLTFVLADIKGCSFPLE